jgi:predicted dehydrogenase
MKIGIIGSGNIWGTAAKLFAKPAMRWRLVIHGAQNL